MKKNFNFFFNNFNQFEFAFEIAFDACFIKNNSKIKNHVPEEISRLLF